MRMIPLALLLASCVQAPRVDPDPRETLSLYLAAVMRPTPTPEDRCHERDPIRVHPSHRLAVGR